jgi:hypothetical protein
MRKRMQAETVELKSLGGGQGEVKYKSGSVGEREVIVINDGCVSLLMRRLTYERQTDSAALVIFLLVK